MDKNKDKENIKQIGDIKEGFLTPEDRGYTPPLNAQAETINKLKGLNATLLDITNEDNLEDDNFAKLGLIVRNSAITGWNMGIVKARLGEERTMHDFSREDNIRTSGYPGIPQQEINEEVQHSDYINRMVQSDMAKEQKETMESQNKTLEQYTFDKYPEYVAAARSANARKDSLIATLPNAPVQFAANLAGGFIEGLADPVELSKMVAINAVTGGLGGGATTYLSDMFLGALDNYTTTNTETQILYGRDATTKEKAERAAMGAAMQVGMTALGKGIRKVIDIKNKRAIDQNMYAREDILKRSYEQRFVKSEDGKWAETPNKRFENEPVNLEDININPQKTAKAMSDSLYGKNGMTDDLINAEKLTVGGDWEVNTGNVTPSPESTIDNLKINTRYDGSDVEIFTPRKINTDKTMNYVEVQDLIARKSSVNKLELDPEGIKTEIPIMGNKKVNAVKYALYTDKKLNDISTSLVMAGESLARKTEELYLKDYEKGLKIGDISRAVEREKLISAAKPTIENNIKEIITKPLDTAYESSHNTAIYQAGQAMGKYGYGEFILKNNDGDLARSFVTGDTSGILSGESWKAFNDSNMKTHEILFSERAKMDIIDAMNIENRYRDMLNIDENGNISYKNNTGTVLDKGTEGLVDLYINRKNAKGANVKNDYQRLGLTEPNDVVDIINTTIEPGQLNAFAIENIINKNFDGNNSIKATKILKDMGVLVDKDGVLTVDRKSIMKGLMELENRYMNETNYDTKKLMGEVLEALNDPEKSPFQVRDSEGKVTGKMSGKDILLQDYRDEVVSVSDAAKLNTYFQTRVQDAVLKKLKNINENLRSGHLDDFIDDVRTTEKINKSLERISNSLQDIDAKNIESKLGSKSFQNDLQTLRDFNDIYNFVDKEAFDFLDSGRYVDKEKYIDDIITKEKDVVNKSYDNLKGHIEDTKNKAEVDLKENINNVETKKLQDIEKAENDAVQEGVELKQQFEDYKEYKKKISETTKNNEKLKQYEAKYEEWAKKKAEHEELEKFKSEDYQEKLSQYENEKAKHEDVETQRYKAEEDQFNKEYEEALANREKAIDEELQKRKEEKAKIVKEKKVTDRSNAEFEKANAERQSNIDAEYKRSMKDYEENQKAIKEAEEHNAKAETKESLDEAQRDYEIQKTAWERTRDRKSKVVDELQEDINKYPELYEDLPEDIKKFITKPNVKDSYNKEVLALSKLLESDELQYVPKSFDSEITIDGTKAKIKIEKGVYKNPTELRKKLEKQLPKELLDKATPKQLQTMVNKMTNPRRYGIANLKSGRIEKEALDYLVKSYGQDAVDQIKTGKIISSKTKLEGMERLMKDAEISKHFDKVRDYQKVLDNEPKQPKIKAKKVKKIEVPKQMDKPSLEAIEKKYPKINIEDYAEEVTQKSTIKADRRSIEKEFPKPKKNKPEPIKKFEGKKPSKPKKSEFTRKEPVRPEGEYLELDPLQYSMRYNTLREGLSEITQRKLAKISDIKALAAKNIETYKAENLSMNTMYKDMINNVDDFIKNMKKSKDIVEWANSDKALGVVEGMDSLSKILPDGDLKLEVDNLLNAIYQLSDLKDTKKLDRAVGKEYVAEALGNIKEKIKSVNKEAITSKRNKIKELKDTYKDLMKAYKNTKKGKSLDPYKDVDIDAYKAKIEALNKEVGGILKEDQTLPFRAIQMHKDMIENTKKALDDGVLGSIDKTARPKMLTSENVRMARLGAVINKHRLLADRAWYEIKSPDNIVRTALKDGRLDNKYWNIRDLINDNDIKNIADVPDGFAKKVINPQYVERFAKLYEKAVDLFGEVKDADGNYRNMNIDEFALSYFKFLGDLNRTKVDVKRWTGEKLSLGDLNGYFKDTDSMIKFMTMEDDSIGRVGYIKSNADMMNYFTGKMAKDIAEQTVLGTSLNRFISMIEMRSKNAKGAVRSALDKAGVDEIKTAHQAMIEEGVKKLRIYSGNDPFSNKYWSESGAEKLFGAIREWIMGSILNGVGLLETFTNPVSNAARIKHYTGQSKWATTGKNLKATPGAFIKTIGRYAQDNVTMLGSLTRPIYRSIIDGLEPIINLQKFNKDFVVDSDMFRMKSTHKYVNAMLRKLQAGDVANRHIQMADFTGGRGFGKKLKSSIIETAYSMQKSADYQKRVLAGVNAFSTMDMIRDLSNMSELNSSQINLRNLLKQYGIVSDDDLYKLQDFLKKYSDDNGSMDLDLLDYTNTIKNIDAEDLANFQNAYGIFTGLYKHMEDYGDSNKFKAHNNEFMDKIWSFLRRTTMGMGKTDLMDTFYTLDDNGLYINRFKHGMDQYQSPSGRAFGATKVGLGMALDTASYLSLLGLAGTAGYVAQAVFRKPLETARMTAEIKGDYKNILETIDWDNDGEDMKEYLIAGVLMAMKRGVTQYPAFAFLGGGNFINDTADNIYKTTALILNEMPYLAQNRSVQLALSKFGLDKESIEKKARGYKFGDFRDGALYTVWETFMGGRAYSGVVDLAMSFNETAAETELRKTNDMKRLEYTFRNSETGAFSAKEMYRKIANLSFDIADSQKTSDSMLAETYMKMAQKEDLLSEDEVKEYKDAVVELSGIPEKVKDLPPKVKDVAEKVPEFMGIKDNYDKMETQKKILSAVANGMDRKDTINATTGNKVNQFETYLTGDPSKLKGIRKEMYDDMKKDFNITDDKELFRIICSADSPKKALEEIQNTFKPKAEFVSKISKDAEFDKNLPFIFSLEGGYLNDPSTGEESMYGITRETAAANGYYGDMRQLPKELAAQIYRGSYYNPVAKLTNDRATLSVLFDAAVNHGLGYAREIYKKFGDDPQALIKERVRKYHAIAANDPNKAKYLKSWMNRMGRLEEFIAKSSGQDMQNAAANEVMAQQSVGIPQIAMQEQQPIIPDISTQEQVESPKIEKLLRDDIEDEDKTSPINPTYGTKVSPEIVEEVKPIDKVMEDLKEDDKSEEKNKDTDKESKIKTKKDEEPKDDIKLASTQSKHKDDLQKKLVSKLLNKPLGTVLEAIELYEKNNK